MNERTDFADDGADDEEGFVEFEELVDDFIEQRLSMMEQHSDKYVTRDAFVAQALLLIDLAMLSTTQPDGTAEQLKDLLGKFSEPSVQITEPPTPEWAAHVIYLAVEYIREQREAAHQHHQMHCQDCNPPENRNN